MKIYTEIAREVLRAKELHPHWPSDIIHAVSIVSEESGEAIRAALQYTYEGGNLSNIRSELIQCAATCIRAIEQMDGHV